MAETVELDWINAVVNRPINNPTNGLLVAMNIVLATSLFNFPSEKVKKSIENMKISSPKIIETIVIRFFLYTLPLRTLLIQT
jgi:hypothetical protein